MHSDLNKAIVKTLCYSQIFSYPLTVSELWLYLIHNRSIGREEFSQHLEKFQYLYEFEDQYIVLPGDRKLIRERKLRMKESRKKLARAVFVSHLLSFIPTIKLIGVSGSLSMYNAKKEDDIDLFFITSKNTLWLTRFIVSTLLLAVSQKRGKNERFAKDKICPNMFMDEDNLSLSSRNIYTAHEIAQMKVIISKDNMHQRFLSKNQWVLKFMPHAFIPSKQKKKKDGILTAFLKIQNLVFYTAQYLYMKKRITKEKVRHNYAAFHPKNTEGAVSIMYDLKVNTYTGIIKENLRKKRVSELHILN